MPAKLLYRKDRDLYLIRFSAGSRRVDRSTGYSKKQQGLAQKTFTRWANDFETFRADGTRILDPFDLAAFNAYKSGANSQIRITLRDAIAIFLADREGLRESSWRMYESVLRLFSETVPAGITLDMVQQKQVLAFILSRKNDVTRASYRRRIMVFWNWAKEMGYIETVPIIQLTRTPAQDFPKFLTHEQVLTVLACIRESDDFRWLADAAEFAYLTGIREGELAALRWQDVTADGFVEIRSHAEHRTKSGQSRRVPLPMAGIELIRNLPRTCGFVFAGHAGKGLSLDHMRKRFKRFATNAGLVGVTFYWLRHSYSQRLAEAGVHPRDAQALLGHADGRTTLKYYTHVDHGRLTNTVIQTFHNLYKD